MPGPLKLGFGVVVLNGKLNVIAGYSMVDGVGSVSSDVYQYDSCLNSWSKIANMNVPRYDFACAEVNGVVYAVGGYGVNGESLSCAEAYDPESDKWTLIESLRRPRWGCFACGFEGKLYVMGGRSSFTIGNSRFVDVYDPKKTHVVRDEKRVCYGHCSCCCRKEAFFVWNGRTRENLLYLTLKITRGRWCLCL